MKTRCSIFSLGSALLLASACGGGRDRAPAEALDRAATTLPPGGHPGVRLADASPALLARRDAHQRAGRIAEELRSTLAAPGDLDRGALVRGAARLEAALAALTAAGIEDEARLVELGRPDRAARLRELREGRDAKASALLARLRDPGLDAQGGPGAPRGALRGQLASELAAALRVDQEPSGPRATPVRRASPLRAGAQEQRRPRFTASRGTTAAGSPSSQPNKAAPFEPVCLEGSSDPLCLPARGGDFTPLIRAQVEELGSDPYRIYAFVKNEIAVEPYRGVGKSADAVLRTRTAGVHEHVLLLATLLRAAGYPVELAEGWTFVPIGTIQSWLGGADEDAARELLGRFLREAKYDPSGALAGYFLLLPWVETFVPLGGLFGDPPAPIVPGTRTTGACPAYSASATGSASQNTVDCPITLPAGARLIAGTCELAGGEGMGDTYLRLTDPSGNEVASDDDSCGYPYARIDRTFTAGGVYQLRQGCYGVNACSGTTGYEIITPPVAPGRRWVPLMTYLSRTTVSLEHTGDIAFFPFDEQSFLSEVRAELAHEVVRRSLATGLAASGADHTAAEVPARLARSRERIGALPTTLPVEVMDAATITRSADFADTLHLKAIVTLSLDPQYYYEFRQTLYAVDLDRKRLTITYEPSDEYEQTLADGFGGLHGAPPGSVLVAGILRLDGVELARTNPVYYADQLLNLKVHLEQHGREENSRNKWRQNGSSFAIQLDGLQLDDASVADCQAALAATAGAYAASGIPAVDVEPLTGALLACAGTKYLNDNDRMLRESAALYGYTRVRGAQHLTAEASLDVHYLFDRPYLVVPGGAVLDAWGLTNTNVALSSASRGAARASELTRVNAYGSSALEHQLWEHFLFEYSVSTTKLLQLASVQGMPVYDLPAYTDEATVRGLLTHDEAVLAAIIAQLADGARVVTHQAPLTVNRWTGSGWFVEAPTFFGMLISGGLSAATAPGAPALPQSADLPSSALSRRLASSEGTGRVAHGGAATEDPPPAPPGGGADDPTGAAKTNSADPVNLASGNLFLEEVDVSIRSVGFNLEHRRRYNSGLDYSGAVGSRWTGTYESAVLPTETASQVRYLDEHGGTRLYTEASFGEGVFVGPPGHHSTITRTASAWVHRSKHGFRRLYDLATGRLIRLEDRQGNAQVLTYDAAGNLVLVSDGRGASLAFTHDPQGRITSMSDHTGRTWTYGHDASGNLTSVVYPSDPVTLPASFLYAYDASSRLVAQTDPRGNTNTTSYYADGKVLRQVFPDGGRTYHHVYDLSQRLTEVTDPDGFVHRHYFDEIGNAIRVIHPDGRVDTYEYDADRNLVSWTDAAGAVHAWSHDASGNMTASIPPLSAPTTYTHEPVFNLQLTASDDRGIFGEVTYDAFGNMTSRTDADGVPATFSASPSGQLESMTDRAGYSAGLEHDERGRITSITDRAGRTTSFAYDDLNRTTRRILPDGQVLDYTFDARDRLLTITEDGELLYSYDHDANGNRIAETTSSGATTLYGYDEANHLREVTAPSGDVVVLLRNGRKLITALVDSSANRRAWEYDDAGRLSATIDEQGNRAEITRDARGYVTSARDPLGRITRFSFDAEGRLERVTHPGGTFETTTYDSRGNVATTTDRSGATITRSYDARRNLTAWTGPLGATWQFSHDERGGSIGSVDPLGRSTSFAFDAEGRPVTAIDERGIRSDLTLDGYGRKTLRVIRGPGGDVLETVSSAYAWTGELLSASDSNSALTFEYDALRRMTSAQTSATGASAATSITKEYTARNALARQVVLGRETTYAQDADDYVTRIDDEEGGEIRLRYDAKHQAFFVEYPNGTSVGTARDAAGQVTAISHRRGRSDLGSFGYSWDDDGNITHRTTRSGTWSYGYDASQRVTSATPAGGSPETWTYDLAGNRASAGAAAYTYDAANQLLTDGTYSYEYDAAGNRTRKISLADTSHHTEYSWDYDHRLTAVVERAGGVELRRETYTHDARGRRIQKVSGGQVTRYVYDDWSIVAVLDGADNLIARFVWSPWIDRPLVMVRDGESFYYHQDLIGNVVALTNEAGDVVQRYEYDTFGRRTFVLDPGFDQPFGFQGQVQDATGLVQMRHRDLDPETGRFLQQDPARAAGGSNFYSFAGDNPVRFVDPFGLTPAPAAGTPGGGPVGAGGAEGPAIQRKIGFAYVDNGGTGHAMMAYTDDNGAVRFIDPRGNGPIYGDTALLPRSLTNALLFYKADITVSWYNQSKGQAAATDALVASIDARNKALGFDTGGTAIVGHYNLGFNNCVDQVYTLIIKGSQGQLQGPVARTPFGTELDLNAAYMAPGSSTGEQPHGREVFRPDGKHQVMPPPTEYSGDLPAIPLGGP